MKNIFIWILFGQTLCLGACSSYERKIEETKGLEAKNSSTVVLNQNEVSFSLENKERALAHKISDHLDHAASVSIDQIGEYESWSLVCGQPLELSGGPIDYSKTSLSEQAAAGILDDYYCALLELDQASNKALVRELVVGDTDSPLFDWVEKYGLSESILDFD